MVGSAQYEVKQHAATFAAVEKKYGAAASVLTGFWGLESDFGANSLARSSARWRHYTSMTPGASGFLPPATVRRPAHRQARVRRDDRRLGGEFGGLQFTASDYLKNAVDFDGDVGHRDLIHSIPDTLASGAKLLVGLRWASWRAAGGARSRRPSWQEADLTITHPRSQWVAWACGWRTGRRCRPTTWRRRWAATGQPSWPTGISRPSSLELGLRLFDRGRLFRHPPCRRTRPWRQDRHAADHAADDGIAATACSSRLTRSARSTASSAPAPAPQYGWRRSRPGGRPSVELMSAWAAAALATSSPSRQSGLQPFASRTAAVRRWRALIVYEGSDAPCAVSADGAMPRFDAPGAGSCAVEDARTIPAYRRRTNDTLKSLMRPGTGRGRWRTFHAEDFPDA